MSVPFQLPALPFDLPGLPSQLPTFPYHLPVYQFGGITAADATGWLGLIFVGLASMFMLLRMLLLKVTRNIAAIRLTHVVIAALAGFFMIVHILYTFALPTNLSLDLGYASLVVGAIVWLSGTAFLERLRDSLFFHGTLSSALLGVVMVHAATSPVNMPALLSDSLLGATLIIMMANAVAQLKKAGPGKRPAAPGPRPAAPPPPPPRPGVVP